jgi:hypothetical protein
VPTIRHGCTVATAGTSTVRCNASAAVVVVVLVAARVSRGVRSGGGGRGA